MNLTEVLLAVIVSLAVIAGGYTLYTNVSDKNEVAQVMQNVSLLRANIEDAYDGNYENLSSDASDGSLYDLGILPERLARVSASGTTPATKWGPITIEAGSDPSTYTISFSGLSKDICLHLGRFQYRSWAKVEAGGTAVWTRGTDTGLKTAELVQACSSHSVQITGYAVHAAAGMNCGILHPDFASGNRVRGRRVCPQFLIHRHGALYGHDTRIGAVAATVGPHGPYPAVLHGHRAVRNLPAAQPCDTVPASRELKTFQRNVFEVQGIVGLDIRPDTEEAAVCIVPMPVL